MTLRHEICWLVLGLLTAGLLCQTSCSRNRRESKGETNSGQGQSAPAVQQARSEGIQASGPFPADTIFRRARGGAYDAIVSMYHDQGQIAMKLMGFERGVTVQGGLPVPITTPAHGTAFDIAGEGKANPQGLWQAYSLACRMAANRKRL